MGAGREIRLEPLTREAFAPYGEVVEAAGEAESINRGTAKNYSDLARIDVTAGGGRPRLSLYRATPVRLPFAIRLLERHALGSQCFVPTGGQRFVAVVAPPGDPVDAGAIRAFLANGRQGVNYRPGTWHHPLLAWGAPGEFLVIDRAGEGTDCDECPLDDLGLVLTDAGPARRLTRRRARRSRTSAR